jgi:hypothetical protein
VPPPALAPGAGASAERTQIVGRAGGGGAEEGSAGDNKARPWRSSQKLQRHKSPVTALVFVGEGELGPKPVLFTAAGDWKVVHWEPDDDGKWDVVSEVPVSHSAWIMDLCYVSKTVCSLSATRGPVRHMTACVILYDIDI